MINHIQARCLRTGPKEVMHIVPLSDLNASRVKKRKKKKKEKKEGDWLRISDLYENQVEDTRLQVTFLSAFTSNSPAKKLPTQNNETLLGIKLR